VAPDGSITSGRTSPSFGCWPPAIASLIVFAPHRRVATGGPMRTPNAAALLQMRGQRAQVPTEVDGVQSITGPSGRYAR
jgi:hypothetical protein